MPFYAKFLKKTLAVKIEVFISKGSAFNGEHYFSYSKKKFLQKINI